MSLKKIGEYYVDDYSRLLSQGVYAPTYKRVPTILYRTLTFFLIVTSIIL